VRELENVIRLALLRGRNYPITAGIVRDALAGSPAITRDRKGIADLVAAELALAQTTDDGQASRRVLETVERELYTQAITLAAGNQAKAARWLGVSRVTLREKLRQHGLKSAAESEGAG
jgi:DNA-binding NtrC family response regulator